MTDGVNVDWSLLKTPDYAGDYANAFDLGRQMATSRGAPAKPPAAPMVAPAGPVDLRTHFAHLDESGRQAAAATAEALTGVLHGLQLATPDPRERLRMARHLAAATPSLGIAPAAISLGDVTDQGIAGHLAATLAAQGQIAPPGAPRYLGALDAPPSPSPGAGPATSGPRGLVNPSVQGAARYLGPIN
jgi:hypothetical protein